MESTECGEKWSTLAHELFISRSKISTWRIISYCFFFSRFQTCTAVLTGASQSTARLPSSSWCRSRRSPSSNTSCLSQQSPTSSGWPLFASASTTAWETRLISRSGMPRPVLKGFLLLLGKKYLQKSLFMSNIHTKQHKRNIKLKRKCELL